MTTMWDSSNPALNNADAFDKFYGKNMFATRADVTTVQGVVNKTAILLGIAVMGGALGYWIIQQGTSLTFITISCLTSMAVGFGIALFLCSNPLRAKYIAPVYAVVEGVFLGALSGGLDKWLAQMQIKLAGGVALQAFIITMSIMIAMLGLYSAGILKPTRMFTAIVSVATVGIMLTYLISWPLALLFGIDLPFVGLTSAFGSGWTPLIGLGVNVLILGVASMWLIIDFAKVEEQVAAEAPRAMEWYLGFALLVSLAWIYYEAVKLVFRLALLFSDRD